MAGAIVIVEEEEAPRVPSATLIVVVKETGSVGVRQSWNKRGSLHSTSTT
jgi:hypothetical protein